MTSWMLSRTKTPLKLDYERYICKAEHAEH
jgi:hypothetical protein